MNAVTLNEDHMHHFHVLSVVTILKNSCTSIPEYLNTFPSDITFLLDIFFLSGAVLGLLHILTRIAVHAYVAIGSYGLSRADL
jgi:hypothetical protein